MRISDLIAGAALLVALIGAFLVHRQNQRRAAPATPNTSVQISYGVDKKKTKGSAQSNAPGFKGTLTVARVPVKLESAHFFIRRQSGEAYIELHSFRAQFEPQRDRPVVEGGHLIHAMPANVEGFKQSLAGAEAVFVEFKDISGQIFRSQELRVRSSMDAVGAPD